MYTLGSRLFIVVLCAVLALGAAGCDTKTTGLVPAYMSIDSLVPADTNGVRQRDFPGRAFPEVGFYIDGRDIGTYELDLPDQPGRMIQPVIGNHKLSVYGYVRADGLRSSRVNYPFYEGFDTTITFLPETRYRLGTRVLRESKFLARPFPLEEYFEDTSLSVYSGPNGTRRVRVVKDSLNADGTFWKKGGFGIVYAPPGANPVLEIVAKQAVKLPQNTTKPLYAEIDYRTNMEFVAGFYKPDNNPIYGNVVYANPNAWKRIYVFLSDEAEAAEQGDKLRFFIQGVNTDSTKANYIAIDNIRLLHYKPRL